MRPALIDPHIRCTVLHCIHLAVSNTCFLSGCNERHLANCRTVLREELTVSSSGSRKILPYHGTWRFITKLTTALVPVPNYINPVHVRPSHVLKLHFNIILSPTPGVPTGCFPSAFPTESLQALPFPCMPLHGPAAQTWKLLLRISPEPAFYSDNLQQRDVILTRFRRRLAAGRSCPGGGPGGGTSRQEPWRPRELPAEEGLLFFRY